VKHLVPWICYFFHSNHKVHSTHMALRHFGLHRWCGFVSILEASFNVMLFKTEN